MAPRRLRSGWMGTRSCAHCQWYYRTPVRAGCVRGYWELRMPDRGTLNRCLRAASRCPGYLHSVMGS